VWSLWCRKVMVRYWALLACFLLLGYLFCILLYRFFFDLLLFGMGKIAERKERERSQDWKSINLAIFLLFLMQVFTPRAAKKSFWRFKESNKRQIQTILHHQSAIASVLFVWFGKGCFCFSFLSLFAFFLV